MTKNLPKQARGFTLIEMVTVIIILGVLAVGASGFLQFGARIFAESSDREQIISSARFVIERLNREIRHALPNSAYVTGGCLTFTPILESTIYTEIPVAPEAASNKITVVKFDEAFDSDWQVVVYPLTPSDLTSGSNKIFDINSIANLAGDEREITLSSSIQFASDSPTKRLFFVNGTVSYCLSGTNLNRDGILMAQNIINNDVFEVEEASLQRNGYVQVKLTFEQNNERVAFSNEIQVPNVP